MVHRRLARRVGVGLEVGHVEAVDRADVDDPRRVAGRRRGRQGGHEVAGQVEHALHVEVEHAVPRGVGELGQRRAPVGPGVVDQDVERSLTLGDDRRPAAGTRRARSGWPAPRCTRRSRRARPRPASQTSALRDEMYTLAPASTKPRAIINPMPRLPPVTSAVLPSMENRSVMAARLGGDRRRPLPRHRAWF